MNSNELNKLLIKNIPQIQQQYYEEVGWQEGNDTGSHVVFGDVLTPFLKNCIFEKKYREIAYIATFLEELLLIGDDYVTEVVIFSVFESLVDLLSQDARAVSLLGEKSKQVLCELVST